MPPTFFPRSEDEMLALSPDILVSCYEFLRATPPFRRWKLPHADDVEFHINAAKDRYGDHDLLPGEEHRIRISAALCVNTAGLITTMAHEMIHVAQGVAGETRDHGKRFKRRLLLVCKHHGFDVETM